MPPEPRRVKAVPIRPEDILQCFLYDKTGFPNKEPDSVTVLQRLRLLDVPEDVKPLYGFFDAARGCFMLLLEHPSFPLLDAGEIPSIIYSECKHFYVDSTGKECMPPSIEYRSGDGPEPTKFREFL